MIFRMLFTSFKRISSAEVIYSARDILLIFGFVYLYWARFGDRPGLPDAIKFAYSNYVIIFNYSLIN